MGFARWYDEHIVPRVIRCACSSPAIMKVREQVVPRASGKVFEIGCGGGINQRFYDPARVTGFSGMDPSSKGLDYAREAATAKGWQADIRQGFGEAIPFEDESFDCVVCTYTLCSVDNQAATVGELRRILKSSDDAEHQEEERAAEAAQRASYERSQAEARVHADAEHLGTRRLLLQVHVVQARLQGLEAAGAQVEVLVVVGRGGLAFARAIHAAQFVLKPLQ